MPPRVLCLLVDGFEELEAIAPVDVLRRAGAEVVLASLNDKKLVTGRNGIAVQADASLADLGDDSFHLLFLPGGPGVKALREDGRPAALARAFAKANKPVGAICAAPTVLKDAGLLDGKRFTSHFSVYDELPGVLKDKGWVEDAWLLTGRGAGVALEFGLLLVRRLFGEAKAEEVAKAVMF